jgi:hypothetical protein
VARGRWIGLNNKYQQDTLSVLKTDVQNNSINDNHLAQYIAASAPLHCADGWSFLGRALQCHVRGDATSAIHLAYYAELRAANSLLATQGIGIFDNPSVSVNSSGNCQRVPGYGTHDLAWLALEHWADGQTAASLLSDLISVEGIPHKVWLDSFQSSSSFNRGQIAKEWLETWGLDLQRFVADREARNQASYRPSQITPVPQSKILESIKFISEVWKLHEPSGQSRFDILDRFLVRRSLEKTYLSVKGKPAEAARKDFKREVESMVSNVKPSGRGAGEWVRFFTRKSEPDDPAVIRMAMDLKKAQNKPNHMEVISRAVLLLRVATGACSQFLSSAKFSAPELEFWWEQLGQGRGLWNLGMKPERLTDLWADVAAAIEQLGGWAELNKATATYARWQVECASDLSTLGSCERIGLWGLGL